MRRPSLPTLTALIAALAAIGISALVVWNQISTTAPLSGGGAVINFAPSTEVGGPFELINGEGETVTEKAFLGGYSLVYFGYTYCPDVCPTELSNIVAAMDAMDPALAEKITPFFITIDPERDTPEVVKDYAAAFHPRMIGLTGDIDAIRDIAQSYRVYFAKAGEGEDYLMDHSGYVYLIGPDGDLATMFRPNADAPSMGGVLETFVSKSG